jgi:putative cardiolipin synthase
MRRGKTATFALLLLCWLPLLQLAGCATIPFDYPRRVSSALSLPEATALGKEIKPLVLKHRGESGFYLLSSGTEAFLARVLLIDAADKTLDLQYYIFQADLTGKFMLDRIMAAAARGVRVRLLLDDWRETSKMDWWLTMMEIYPNIEVRVFNPFGGLRSNPLSRPLQAIFGPQRLRARMHNKAFIVDNSVTIVGGRNIADAYFGASTDFHFRDLDVLAVGPIARQVSTVFDDYWNCALAIPLKAIVSHQFGPADLEKARCRLTAEREALKNSVYGIKMRQSDFLKRAETGKLPFVWAPAEVLSDPPLKVIDPGKPAHPAKMAKQIRGFLESAQHEILMVSPYLVPGKAGVQWFKKMRERGVTVKIITNSFASTDSLVAQFGYMRYRKALLRLGVELYELRATPGRGGGAEDEPYGAEGFGQTAGSGGGTLGSSLSSRGTLHAKILILDRQAVFVGSFNLDPRSARFDTQNGLVIHSPQLAAQTAVLFAKDASPALTYRVRLTADDDLVWITEVNGREKRYYREPLSGFWRRLSGRFLYLLIPESML